MDYARFRFDSYTIDIHGMIDVATNTQYISPKCWDGKDRSVLKEVGSRTHYAFEFETTNKRLLKTLQRYEKRGTLPDFRFEQLFDGYFSWGEGEAEILTLEVCPQRAAPTTVWISFAQPGVLKWRKEPPDAPEKGARRGGKQKVIRR